MDNPIVATYQPGLLKSSTSNPNFSHTHTSGFVTSNDKNLQVPPLTTTGNHVASHSKERISYYYNPDVANYHFGEGHPMKPPRLALTNQLVIGYGLHKRMDVYCPRRATDEEIADFHSEDYIEFLKRVSPENAAQFAPFMGKFNLGVDDCPVFDGMYEFCRLYSGGSVEAARKLISGYTDIAINYSGGLHHAKKWEASGFCYVNDINLAILQLLRYFPRVLYIDIDVHHGDGVQEAFYSSPRVMTASFHKYDGQFFPGTGSLDEIGVKAGKYYSVNVPLQEYIDDASYAYIFKYVMTLVMDKFRPSVIVLQCGADSLASDRLGCFNLSIKGHGECVKFMKSFRVPMLVLGGGGYTIRNVARCWTHETSILTNTPVSEQLPRTDYHDHFAPDYSLFPKIVDNNLENANTRVYLDNLKQQITEQLRYVGAAPSVQMQEIPPNIQHFMETNEWVDVLEDSYPDTRPMEGELDIMNNLRDKELVEEDVREFYDREEGGGRDGEMIVESVVVEASSMPSEVEVTEQPTEGGGSRVSE